MKRLNFLEKILFLINNIIVLILLVTYVVPFLNPNKFSILSILSISYPVIIILNICFAIIWIIKLKPHFILSLIVILIGYNHLEAFYAFNRVEVESETTNNNSLKLLSYNVRQFNRYKWIKSNTIEEDICDFINQQNVDIVCLQEYRTNHKLNIKLPFKYIHKTKASGLAIYSKYPIIKTESLNFEHSSNNAIYTDLKINNEFIRIYNTHLQSFSIDLSDDYYTKNKLKRLYHKMNIVFKTQATQINKLNRHIKTSPYKTIICGDLNSTAFSWIYKQISENFFYSIQSLYCSVSLAH